MIQLQLLLAVDQRDLASESILPESFGKKLIAASLHQTLPRQFAISELRQS